MGHFGRVMSRRPKNRELGRQNAVQQRDTSATMGPSVTIAFVEGSKRAASLVNAWGPSYTQKPAEIPAVSAEAKPNC